jgi:hypothetical protein
MRKVVFVLVACVLIGAGIGFYGQPSADAFKVAGAARRTAQRAFARHLTSALPNGSPSSAAWVVSDGEPPLAIIQTQSLPQSPSPQRDIDFTRSTDQSIAAAALIPTDVPAGLLPTSGSEPQYFAPAWNNPFIGPGNNCYAYACDDASDLRINDCDFPQPGSTAGEAPCDRSEFTVDLLRRRAAADGLAIVPSGREDLPPPEGFYKIALFVAPGEDYHWYRQDDDGYWSHKLGDGPVLNVDGDGHAITDPRTASHNYENHFEPITGRAIGGYNYRQFGGFFYVPEGGIRLRSGHPGAGAP